MAKGKSALGVSKKTLDFDKRSELLQKRKAAKPKKKENIVVRIRKFFKDVKIELSKVTWLNREQLTASTGVVIVAIILFGIYVGVIDWIFLQIVTALGIIPMAK